MLFLITSLFSVNAFPEPVMSATCCFISIVALNEAACDSLVRVNGTIPFYHQS